VKLARLKSLDASSRQAHNADNWRSPPKAKEWHAGGHRRAEENEAQDVSRPGVSSDALGFAIFDGRRAGRF